MWEMALVCGKRYKYVGNGLDMWGNGFSMSEIA